MRTKSLLGAAALVALAATGCYPAAGPLTDEDMAAIDGLRTAYRDGVLAGDAAAIAAVYTEDATEMPPHMTMRQGRAAIQTAYETMPAATTFTTTAMVTEGLGALAYEWGTWTYSADMEGMDEPYRDVGKYISIMEKQADGTWLMKAVMWNSDIPLPTPE